jgi:hypothetical protein
MTKLRFGRVATIATVGLAAAGVALPAWAFLNISGSTTTGSYTASTMTAPTAVTATPSIVSHVPQVAVSWSAPATPSGVSYTYNVLRDGGAAAAACTGIVSSAATVSCTDTGAALTPGSSHTYAVQAKLTADTAWTATSSPVVNATIGHDRYFTLSGAPSTATAGSAFNVTVTAMDANIVDSSYASKSSDALSITGTSSPSPSNTKPTVSSTVTFNASSVATASVTLFAATTSSQSFTISDATDSGSASVNSVAAASGSLSLTNCKYGATSVTCTSMGNSNNALSGATLTFQVARSSTDAYSNSLTLDAETNGITVTISPNTKGGPNSGSLSFASGATTTTTAYSWTPTGTGSMTVTATGTAGSWSGQSVSQSVKL